MDGTPAAADKQLVAAAAAAARLACLASYRRRSVEPSARGTSVLFADGDPRPQPLPTNEPHRENARAKH